MKKTIRLYACALILMLIAASATLTGEAPDITVSTDTIPADKAATADTVLADKTDAVAAPVNTVSADTVPAPTTAAPESHHRRYVGQVLINAGGPYQARRNRPVRLLGNAKSRFAEIVRYEWRFTNVAGPEFVSDSNIIVQFTYPDAGRYSAVYTVWLDNGTRVSDTALVEVGGWIPSANAGEDIVTRVGRRVKLNGTGSSPNGGKIVRYEWDFDGDGIYSWNSETEGTVERVFRTFSHPVLRVTDSDGNTASDTVRVVICPKGMMTVPGGKFCIDKYEWPNKRGTVPHTNVTYEEAVTACAGVGKRLCTPEEWSRACRNDSNIRPADGHTYSYGNNYDFRRCNTLDNPGTRNAPSRSGSFGNCAGQLRIFDMSGNVAEWTASDGTQALAYGGFYQSAAEDSGCESFLPLDRDKAYLYVGFRCCK